MVKPLRTPDGETVRLKTSFALDDKHDVLYTTGRVLFTADEKYMFTINADEIKVTDFETGRLFQTLKGDGELVTCLSLSPDDSVLVTASRSLMMRRWDWRTATELSTFKSLDGPIATMAWDPTATLLATGASDGAIKVWDAAKGYVTHSFKGSQGVVSALTFHPDPKRLLLASSAATDCHVRLWDLQTKKAAGVLESHVSAVRGLVFSADGSQLVSGSRDRTVCVWRLAKKGARLQMAVPVNEAVEGLCMLPAGTVPGGTDKEYFATAGDKGVLRIWGLGTGHCVQRSVAGPTTAEMVELTLLGISQQLVAVTSRQDIVVHRLPGLEVARHVVGYNDEVIDLRCMNDTHLVVATNSEQLRILQMDTHSCHVLQGHTGIVLAVDVSHDSSHVVTAAKDATVRVWRRVDGPDGSLSFPCVAVGTGHTEGVGAVAFARKSAAFAVSGSQDRTVKLWATAPVCDGADEVPEQPMALQARQTHKAHDKDINTIAVAPNDRIFATGSHDRTAKVWSVSDMQLLGTLKGHKRGIWHVEFSPVDQCLATASGDKTIKVWSVADYTCLKTLEGHTGGVLKVTYLTRGLQLASAAADGLVKVWTLRTNECVATMDGHTDKVWALCKNSAEEQVISGGGDSVINVWRDTTVVEEERRAQEAEQLVLMEQELGNLLQAKDYAKAMALALRLNHPRRVRALANELLVDGDGKASFCTVVSGLSSEQLGQLLGYVQDWNTNAKHSLVAQAVLGCVLQTVAPTKLLLVPNMKAILEGLIPYTERHLSRVDRLLQRTFLVDYTCQRLRGGVAPLPDISLSAPHAPMPVQHVAEVAAAEDGGVEGMQQDTHTQEDAGSMQDTNEERGTDSVQQDTHTENGVDGHGTENNEEGRSEGAEGGTKRQAEGEGKATGKRRKKAAGSDSAVKPEVAAEGSRRSRRKQG